MNPHGPNPFTRRQFLHSGLTLASAAATIPWFLNTSALALPRRALGMSSIPGVDENRILVVIQLSGGNDGLNTVVPFGYGDYYKARPGIGIRAEDVLKLSGKNGADGVGLAPQMTGIKELYDNGMAAVIQGVGYPNPNRSHFKSMDIWHTADTTATGDGWLGRYFDSECCGYGKGESGKASGAASKSGNAAPKGAAALPPPANLPANLPVEANSMPGIAIGRTAPLAMQGVKVKPIAFETEDLFRWIGQDVHPSLVDPYAKIESRGVPQGADPNSNASFLLRTALDSQVSSELIRKAVRLTPLVEYPRNELGRQLSMVAAMIRAGLPTRVYYVQLGGFDTHAGQGGAQGRHGQLVGQFAACVKAFYADLHAQENDKRVLTMSFSEFGRRVSQNASQGTDHGTAAPMFLFGPMVRAGVIGDHPSLTDLDDGDLKYQIDFRSVYAGIIDGWMQADAKKILEGEYRVLPVIKKA